VGTKHSSIRRRRRLVDAVRDKDWARARELAHGLIRHNPGFYSPDYLWLAWAELQLGNKQGFDAMRQQLVQRGIKLRAVRNFVYRCRTNPEQIIEAYQEDFSRTPDRATASFVSRLFSTSPNRPQNSVTRAQSHTVAASKRQGAQHINTTPHPVSKNDRKRPTTQAHISEELAKIEDIMEDAHILTWEILPAGWFDNPWQLGNISNGEVSIRFPQLQRIQFLVSLHPKEWYRGICLGQTEYLVAVFDSVAIADYIQHGNALYYCSPQKEIWQRTLRLTKKDARHNGAGRIIHREHWRDSVRALVRSAPP